VAYQHTILKIVEFDRSEGQEKLTTKRWNFEDSVEIYAVWYQLTIGFLSVLGM
jgi:hypothetical protein